MNKRMEISNVQEFTGPNGSEAKKLKEKEQLTLEVMARAGKPLRSGEIAELVNLTKDEASKIVKNLKEKGKITSPKRCFYAPAR